MPPTKCLTVLLWALALLLLWFNSVVRIISIINYLTFGLALDIFVFLNSYILNQKVCKSSISHRKASWVRRLQFDVIQIIIFCRVKPFKWRVAVENWPPGCVLNEIHWWENRVHFQTGICISRKNKTSKHPKKIRIVMWLHKWNVKHIILIDLYISEIHKSSHRNVK